LTSAGDGLSFGVVGSRFTALGVTVLEVADMPADAAALFPVPGFTFYTDTGHEKQLPSHFSNDIILSHLKAHSTFLFPQSYK